MQLLCKHQIDQLEKDLKPNINSVTTMGFIFDSKVIYESAKWFQQNASRFVGIWSVLSNVFCINALGKLQAKLSSREAQIIRSGIGYLIDDQFPPDRTRQYSPTQLGTEFFIGYCGILHEGIRFYGAGFGDRSSCIDAWETYIKQKQLHYKTITQDKSQGKTLQNNN